jgi:OOP family OmpA-OmpF porin
MKNFILKCAFIFSAAFVCVSTNFAQDSMRSAMMVEPPLFSGNDGYRTWSIGVNGAYIKNQISHGLAIQADFMGGKLKANNDKLWVGLPPPGPYASFSTDLNYAFSLSGVVTLANINWSQLHTSVQPYASIGAGAIGFHPTLVTKSGTNVDFGSATDFFVPVGFGLKFNLSSMVNLDLGYTVGFVDGDNLDGYFKDPIISDRFSYGHIGLEFSLGDKRKPQLARHNAPAQMGRMITSGDDALRASLAASEARYNQRLAELNGLQDEINKMKMDSDGDGVSDYFDKCPNTPRGTKVDGSGCALPTPPPPPAPVNTVVEKTTYVITDEDKKIVSEAVRNLEFDFGKSTIRPRSFPYLNRVAELIKTKGISLKLAGHTDNVGSDAANMKLSKDRAESVKNYLESQGANGSRIEATGYGESQPIATNKTDAGRQKNRRVEFTIYN